MTLNDLIEDRDRPLVFLSIATTGLDPDVDSLLALSTLALLPSTGAVESRLALFRCPDRDLFLQAAEHHGISDFMMETAGIDLECAKDVLEAALDGVLVTYNPAFQHSFLSRYADIAKDALIDLPLLAKGIRAGIPADAGRGLRGYAAACASAGRPAPFRRACATEGVDLFIPSGLPCENACQMLYALWISLSGRRLQAAG